MDIYGTISKGLTCINVVKDGGEKEKRIVKRVPRNKGQKLPIG